MTEYSAIVRRRRPVMLPTSSPKRRPPIKQRIPRTSAISLWAAIFGVILLLAATSVREALAQMVSTGAKDRPGLPLPPGMKPPVADFRDLAEEAGLKAVIVSGE